jgi:hypothetical protein
MKSENFGPDIIVQLAALALTVRAAYSLSELFSPKTAPENNPDNPEVEQFKKLPAAVRKQLLKYGSRWQEALFEPKA